MAASALASQLQAIALSHTGQPTRNLPKGRPSLLFDPQEAANIDLQTIHRIGKQGLDELCNVDVRFEPFQDTLFGDVGASYDREMQTKEANEKLNTSITSFLRLLSNYLLLPPAHQALEFLIRRYLVQQYNVEAVLLAALPYHETQLFVRVVQLLDLARTSRWRFLVGRVQQAGASLPRDALVQICSRDLAVLEAICTAAQQVSDAKQASKPLLSFSAVIVMEVLAAVTAVTDELVKRILPYVLDGFKKDAAVEYQAGVLMIAAQLSNRVTLSESLLSSLLRALAGSPPASLQSESLMVIIQIFQTQRPAVVPPKALKPLARFPRLADSLVELTARFDTAPFLRPFLRALVSSARGDDVHEKLLVEIVEKVRIAGEVKSLVSELLKAAGFGGEESKEGKALAQRVLRVLDKRYSVQLDASVNELLKGGATQDESDEEAEEAPKAAKGNALFDFVQETFSGGLHAPLAESGASLYLSVDHPQAEVRRLALERLGALLGEEAEGNEQLRTFLGSAVLRRLADDDPAVVKAALNVPSLVKVAAREPLFEALSSILVKSVGILEGSLEVPIDSKAAVAMARTVLRVLVGDFVGAHQEYSERIAVLLLDHMLVMPKTRKVNREVIIQAAKHAGFSAGLAELAVESDKGEEKKQTKDAAVNNAVVAAFAEGLLAAPKEQTALLRSALTSGARSRPLVVMVLLRALATVKKSKAEGLLEEVMPLLDSEWLRATGLDNLDEDPLKADVTVWAEQGLPQEEEAVTWYKAVRVSPERASLTLLVKGFELAVHLIEKAQPGQKERARLEALFLKLASAPKHFVEGIKPVLESIVEQEAGSGLSQRTEWLVHKFLASEVGARVQERSLELLTESLQGKEISTGDLSSLVPKLLVALSSPAKSVRKAALKIVRTAWVRSADLGEEMQSEEADISDLRKVLETVWGERRNFKADGAYLTSFLSELLSNQDDVMADDAEPSNLRAVFDPQRKWAVSSFLAGAVVERLNTSGQRAVLLGALRQALVSFGSTEQSSSVKKLQPLVITLLKEGVPEDVAFLVEFLGLFTSELASSLVSEGEEGEGPSLEPFIFALQSGGVNADSSDAVAIAAVERVDQQFYAGLTSAAQDWVTAVLLVLMSATKTEALHARVRRALEAIELSPVAIGRLLTLLLDDPTVPGAPATPAKKKKKGAVVKESSDVPSPLQKLVAGDLQVGTALLELLQWKQLSENAHLDALAQQLSVLLRRLMDRSWPPEQATDSKEGALNPRAVYAVQLALASLERLAAQGEVTSVGRKTRGAKKAEGGPFDVDLIVRCIREAPDAPTRNHALALLAALAKISPDEVLHHMLDVATIVGSSSLALDDSASHRVVQSMIGAVVRVYVAHSKDLDQLLGVFITAIPKVPEHRRLSLLEGLLRAVGVVGGLYRVLLLLLRAQVEGRGSEQEEGTSPRSVLVSDTEDWLVRLADALANQYMPSVRLAAYHKLLEATTISDTPSVVSRKLARAVTAFVVSQLSQRGFQGLGQAANTEEEERRAQEGYVALMEQVLLRLRPSAAESGDAKGAKANTEAAYQLLEALYGLMDPAAYLSGISGLLHHQDRHVRRRVLKLLASEVKDSSAEDSPETVAQYSGLASEIAKLLDGPNADPSPSTKQAALSALEAIAQKFGAQSPEPFGASVGAVLANVEGQNLAVTSAAVRCAASICASLGPRALPHLPKVLATILGCAHRQLVAEKEVLLSEDQSELLTVCVSAVETLVSELGAFLSPYLGQILDLVLLQPAVLTSAEGARARALLPEKLPPRLLLDPLMKAYESAIALGPQSERALASLFELVAALNSKLDKQAVAAHHKTIFDFLLRAFDLRRRPPAGVSGFAVGGSVEPVLIRAFVALVVKLSENTFKPLFLRTLEWAETDYLPSEEGALDASEMTQKGSLARNTFLYGLVGELTEKLRSVFVPYFKYLMEGVVSHLGGAAGQGNEGGEAENVGLRPKKKKKKSATEGGFAEAAKMTPQQWELRRLVVSALQKCFQYDTVGFLEAGRFQKFLSPLVAHLRVEAPEDIEETLKASADETLVSTLGHMALAARSDALWRPLNREVLMATRYGEESSGASRTRLLALLVVEFLADRLREEYLILLPETIPFLSELLEDADLKVVAKSQEVVKKLENLSGENLADYF